MKCKYKKFLKAAYINYEEDYCGRGSGTFTKPTVTTPIIVITGTTAIIACAISGATIYYTLDGSTPTSSSTEYTGAITLTLSCTIKAIAVKPGMSDSAVASESYVHYLTQWKIVGNSEVHTDPYLTSWKVSGNSVVDNNTILSCGDLGQDGKYHVKISNGVTIFDIPLTEPLRKVNDVADAIEFHSDTEGKALVTRNLGRILMGDRNFAVRDTKYADYKRFLFMTGVKPASNNNVVANGLCSGYNMITNNQTYNINADGTGTAGIGIDTGGYCYVFDPNYNTASDANAIKAANANTEFIYELATPTTELIDVSPFPVSSTDTYTSANVVPFSAFEHTENKEIWSCGEYNPIDGKYHILVQPQGGSIADIALDAPLRKINDIADTIEFPSNTDGKALVIRNFASADLGNFNWSGRSTTDGYVKKRYSTPINMEVLPNCIGSKVRESVATALCSKYNIVSPFSTSNKVEGIGIFDSSIVTDGQIFIYDSNADTLPATDFKNYIQGIELIYQIIPTTELVDAPQIQEAESYSMVISQGGKAVSWSGFTTE